MSISSLPPVKALRKAFHYGRYKKVLRLLKDGRTLDIGCGQPCESLPDQAFLRFLNRPNAVGVDIKPVQGPYEFHQGDINKLPFPDNSFDNVVAMEVLEHIPDIDAAIREVARVLKPGGVFVMSTPDCHWLWEAFWAAWTRMIGHMWHHTHCISLRAPGWKEALQHHLDVTHFERHWAFDLIFSGVKPAGRR